MILQPCKLIKSCILIDIENFCHLQRLLDVYFKLQVVLDKFSDLLSFFICLCFVFQDSCCDEYIEQLIPQTTPIGKIKVKVFGHSGVGKTTLIESLRSGYFSGFFRRSKSKTSTVIGSSNGKFFKLAYFTWLPFLLFSFDILMHFCFNVILEKGCRTHYLLYGVH